MKTIIQIDLKLFHLFSLLFLNCCFLFAQDILVHDTSGKLYEYSIENCQINFLSDTGLQLTDIAYNTEGSLFGIDFIGNVYTINVDTGVSELFYTLPPPRPGREYNSLTIDHRDVLYITGLDGILYFLNARNLNSGLIAELGIQAVGDMVFIDKDNLLILASNQQLYQFNTSNLEGNVLYTLQNTRGTLLTTFFGCDSLNIFSMQNGRQLGFSQFSPTWDDKNNCNVLNSTGIQVFGSATKSEPFNRTLISINSIETTDVRCNETLGSLQIQADGGFNDLQFSLTNQEYQSELFFGDLLPGEYTVYVNDEKDCPVIGRTTIDLTSNLDIDEIKTYAADCDGKNGRVIINLPAPEMSLDSNLMSSLSLNSVNFGRNLDLNLDAGQYTITNSGCQSNAEMEFTIPEDKCNVFIPNAFSVNASFTENQSFKIDFENPEAITIDEYSIFDSWGNNIYEIKSLTTPSEILWWNGRCYDQTCEEGEYTYKLVLIFDTGVKRIFTGSVLLLH